MSRESRHRTDRDARRKRSCRLTIELLESRRLLSAIPSSMFEWAEPARMSPATEVRRRISARVEETRAEFAAKFELERVLAGPLGSKTVATIHSVPRQGKPESSAGHPPSFAATIPSFQVFVGRKDDNIMRPVGSRMKHFRDSLFEDAESSFGATAENPAGRGLIDIAVNVTGTTPARRSQIVIAVPVVVKSTESLQTDARPQVSPTRAAWTESDPSHVEVQQLDGGVVDLSVADATPVGSEPTTLTISPYPLDSSSTLSRPPTLLPSIGEAQTKPDAFGNVPSMRYAPQAHDLGAQHNASDSTNQHLRKHGVENGGFVELGNQLESISNAAAPTPSLDVTPAKNADAEVSHWIETPFAPSEGNALDVDALVDASVKYSEEGGMIELPIGAEAVELPNPAHLSGAQQRILLASVGPRINDTGLGLYRAFEFAVAPGDPVKLSDVSIESAVQDLYPADEAEFSHGEESVSAAYRATVAVPAITLAATVFAIRSRRRKASTSKHQIVTDSRFLRGDLAFGNGLNDGSE